MTVVMKGYGVTVVPVCNVAGCDEAGGGGHPYLTIEGVPLSLDLCQRHRSLFSGWSAIHGPPGEVKIGATKEAVAAIERGDFDGVQLPKPSQGQSSQPSSAGICSTCGKSVEKRYGGEGRYLPECIDCWTKAEPSHAPLSHGDGE